MASLKKNVERIADIAFYVAIILETLFVLLDKSAYVLKFETWDFRFTFLLFAIKIAATKYNKEEWIGIFALIVLGTLSWHYTGREEVIRIVALVIACKNVEINRVLKIIFWETLIGMLILILLSIFGLYGQVAITDIFRGGGIEETRYCFGMGHPNAFHCMVVMVTILVLAVYDEHMKWWMYLCILLLNILIYRYTDSRTGFIMATSVEGLSFVLHYAKRIRDRIPCLIFSELLLAVTICFSLFVAQYPARYEDILWDIDAKLNGRMWWAFYDGGLAHWSLFSNRISDKYFDMGIVRMFYWYGIIPAAICLLILAIAIYMSWKKRKYNYLFIIISLLLYSIMEAHAVSTYIGRNYSFICIGAILPMLFEKDTRIVSIIDILERLFRWNRNSN